MVFRGIFRFAKKKSQKMKKWFELIKDVLPSDIEFWVFDMEKTGESKVNHEFGAKDWGEIDGIAIYKNIIFLINGYSGNTRNGLDGKYAELKKFENITSPEQLNLKAMNGDARENNKKIKEFLNYVSGKTNLKFIIRKLVVAPNVSTDNLSLWSALKEDEFLLDKIIFKYLYYCFCEVNKDYGFREFLILLNIKKKQIDLKKTSTSNINSPETTSSYSAIFSDIEKEKRCLYSFIVPVEDIMEFIRVLRFECVPENEKAFQRIVDKDRLKIISDNYLNKSESFPTNIILTFDPNIYTEEQKSRIFSNKDPTKNIISISLLKEFGSLIVIDGQHRILSHLKKPERDLPKKVLISIIDFKENHSNDTYKAMSDIFVQINNYHKKISPMVMLRIQALNEPDASFSRWYKIFRELNKKSPSSYFSDMIEFEDTPLKRFQSDDKRRINISSLVKYAGVNGLERGNNNYKGLLDQGFFLKDHLQDLIKDFFEIIKEITKGSQDEESIILSPRDIGGLMRLMVHFINDSRTKDNFMRLNSVEGKAGIKPYLEAINFRRLGSLAYGANAWATMEGYFLGQIRKKYPRFGVSSKLTKSGSKEMKKVMRS